MRALVWATPEAVPEVMAAARCARGSTPPDTRALRMRSEPRAEPRTDGCARARVRRRFSRIALVSACNGRILELERQLFVFGERRSCHCRGLIRGRRVDQLRVTDLLPTLALPEANRADLL